MTKELTQQELIRVYSAYLPYKLQLKYDLYEEIGTLESILKVDDYDDMRLGISSMYRSDNYWEFKPILWDLSMLTNDIEHEGEKFIPIDKIKELYPNTPEFENYVNEWIKYCGIMDSKIEYVCVIKLIEWHFNVFGLYDSQFINKLTITCK